MEATAAPGSLLLGLTPKEGLSELNYSTQLYGVVWSRYFPIKIPDSNIEIVSIDFEICAEFLGEYHSAIYKTSGNDAAFLATESHSRKDTYYKICGDFFAFKDNQRIVGVFVGTPVDWSTYFFRNCSILPSYQGQRLYQHLLGYLISILKNHHIDRIEGDVAPSNLGHIHILNKFGFNVAGVRLSERWGALLQFIKYLNPKHERVFLDQFCYGTRNQMEPKKDLWTSNDRHHKEETS